MSSRDHDQCADERFERLLLDSARGDEKPRNVDAAWQQFDSALRGASLLAAGAGGALAVRRAQRWLAAKWLIWGALTGSALTALSLRPHPDRHTAASALLSTSEAVSPLASSTARVPPGLEAPKPEALPRTAERAAPSRAPVPAHALPPHLRPVQVPVPEQAAERAPEPAPAPAASSTLAAQVALIDAARSALAGGIYSEALRLADRYHADFPSGELSPEAETVAIEALIARSERAPALARAALSCALSRRSARSAREMAGALSERVDSEGRRGHEPKRDRWLFARERDRIGCTRGRAAHAPRRYSHAGVHAGRYASQLSSHLAG